MTPDVLEVHAVVPVGLRGRALGWLRGESGGGASQGGRVRLGDRDVPYRMVEAAESAAAVTEAEGGPAGDGRRLHERVVEGLLGSRSVVPAPHGFRARDEDAVRSFLDRARLPLREALEYFEGCWELRLHVLALPPAAAGGPPPGPTASRAHGEAPRRLFRRLRRRARTARRLAPSGDALLTGAFLLPRGEWIGFVEEASRLEGCHPGLQMDVTGPWAPYDFVRMTPAGPVRDPGPGAA